MELNLTFSPLPNSQEGCLIAILYKNCIGDQGLDLLKNNVDSAAEDPAPKGDGTLKMTKSDHEDDDTQPIMIRGYEGVKEPKSKSKTPKFKPNELGNAFMTDKDDKSEDEEEYLKGDESKPNSSRFKSGCF